MIAKTILITANSAWNLFNFRLPLILRLRELGNRVVLVACSDDHSTRLQEMDLEFVALRELQSLNKGFINNVKLLWEYNLIIKKIKPDVVFSFTIKPNIFCGFVTRVRGVSFYPTITGLGSLFITSKKPLLLIGLLYKGALKKSAKVVFHNEDDMRQFMDLGYVNNNNALVIPGSGVDINRFNYSSINRDEPITFLCIGRMINEKGVHLFMNASKHIQQSNKHLNIYFRLFGQVDQQDPRAISSEEIKNWTNYSNCYYGGFTDQIDEEIREATILVLPTLREGMPRAVLEAMSTGRPIITSDVPGCRQAVRHNKNGLLINPNDVNSLIDAMLEMSSKSNQQLNSMGLYGRKRVVDKFNVELIVSKYEQLLTSI